MKISIIVPIYKGNKYIKKIISMMENNLKVNDEYILELLFINDFPSETLAKVRSLEKRLEIKFFSNTENMGIHYTRVKGLREATGDYILFLDQDDVISHNYFASQLSKLGKRNIVVCNGEINNPSYKRVIYRFSIMHYTVNCSYFYALFDGRIVSPGQCIINKNAIPKFWKENILSKNGADDMFLWLLLLENKQTFAINREKLYIHCYTSQNASLDKKKMISSIREFVRIAKDKKCISNPILSLIEKRVDFEDGKNHDLFYYILGSVRKLIEKINVSR